jgi:putative transposase
VVAAPWDRDRADQAWSSATKWSARTHAFDVEERSHQAGGEELPATTGEFDRFIECYNDERPHQALNMQYPSELYCASPRPYHGLEELEYPFHDRTITVTRCGRICLGKRKINLSQVFAGQNVGIREIAEKIWLVSFMHYDLSFFDHETGRVECAQNPFEAQVLPM